jgi:superfamily II DNA or RNA helicase
MILFPRQLPEMSLTLREYQSEAVDSCLQQWDNGIRGCLMRMATGTGKTPTACAVANEWISRSADHRVMVVSYENELVWQFAQEIEDFMGIVPGIEMASESIDPDAVPLIVVASRQTLMQKPLATQEQRDALLQGYGITDEQLGLATVSIARTLLSSLGRGASVDDAIDVLREFNLGYECDHERKAVARLHKFDWRKHWLLFFDEAHKYSMKLKSVGPLVEWFDQNPEHRRAGLTATPKRFDGVSIGTTLFPGIAIDYPLVSLNSRCALHDGYAVPYLQKYINVEGVDFRQLKQVAGDFDEGELGRILAEEKMLASLVEPLLDLVADRKTLIFSPTVDMAKSVANYINARSEYTCDCGQVGWVPNPMVGDGAACKQCGKEIAFDQITKDTSQSDTVYGSMPKNARREVYRRHKDGVIQFLSVCGLCKEGYNDPDISCVAVFRPVSKKASSLAEQMKGRGCRPLRGLVDGVPTAEERVKRISESEKPTCLIVDLVGITGLGDCATTAHIYADSVEDEVIERAIEYQETGGMPNVEEAIQKAQADIAEERERAKQEREERERLAREAALERSRLEASVRYTEQEIGSGSTGVLRTEVTEGQLKFLRFLGMEFLGWLPSRKQAGRMIDMLKEQGKTPKEVAYMNGIKADHWQMVKPSTKQKRCLFQYGINCEGLSPYQASNLIDQAKSGNRPEQPSPRRGDFDRLLSDIKSAEGEQALTDAAKAVSRSRRQGDISEEEFARLCEVGRAQRELVF